MTLLTIPKSEVNEIAGGENHDSKIELNDEATSPILVFLGTTTFCCEVPFSITVDVFLFFYVVYYTMPYKGMTYNVDKKRINYTFCF